MGKCLCLFWTKDFCEAQSGGKSILNRLCTDQAKKQIICDGLGKQSWDGLDLFEIVKFCWLSSNTVHVNNFMYCYFIANLAGLSQSPWCSQSLHKSCIKPFGGWKYKEVLQKPVSSPDFPSWTLWVSIVSRGTLGSRRGGKWGILQELNCMWLWNWSIN